MVSENKEIWISFVNDDGQEIKGFFKLLEQSQHFVKIISGSNILTIPFHKINKIKEKFNYYVQINEEETKVRKIFINLELFNKITSKVVFYFRIQDSLQRIKEPS